MCLAIAKKPQTRLSRALLKNGFEANSHGAGFAYSHKGKLIVKKGFWKFETFWKAFNAIQKNNPAIVHFRKISSGEESEENCHPFLINKNLAVVHNGTLNDWIGTKKSKKSDTFYFVEIILKPLIELVPNAYNNPVFTYMLDKTIESGNKLIFLDAKGKFSIIREQAGEWIDNCWFSNNSYKTKTWEPSEEEWEQAARYHSRFLNKKTKPAVKEIEKLLGGPSQLGEISVGGKTEKIMSNNEYAEALRKGIGKRGFESLHNFSQLHSEDYSELAESILS